MLLPEALRYSYLFRGLTDQQIESVLGCAEVRECADGTVLVKTGEISRDLMIVLKGDVRIRSPKGHLLLDAGPGFLIGEIALVDQEPRSATAEAVGTTTVAVIPCEKLLELFRKDLLLQACLLENLSWVMCQRLRMGNFQLELLLSERDDEALV